MGIRCAELIGGYNPAMSGMSITKLKKTPRHQSASWLVAVLAISVFVAELAVMFILPVLPPMSEQGTRFLDAILLSLLLIPVFFFLVFRPLINNISEREQAEHALRESESRFHKMADDAPALIWMADTQNLGTWYNQHWLNYTGRSLEQELGFGWIEGMHPDDRPRCAGFCQTAFDKRERFEMEFRLRRADDTYGWLADVGTPRFDENGEFLGYIGYCWEVDNRKEAELKLQLSASVFTHAREGILITDQNGTIIEANDMFSQITGYSREESIGQNPRMLQSGQQPPEFYSSMWNELLQTGYWSGEIWNRRKNGEAYAELLTISALKDSTGITLNYVALFSDITSIKNHQKQLEHTAHYDALTKLPNRVLLSDRLQQTMLQTIRRNRSMAVAFLDLDGFKQVNDTHGHKVGDELLIAISQRIKSALREGDTLARIGGDEFIALIVDLEEPQDCDPVLARVLQAAAECYVPN